jgi:glycerol-3-phosphate acyltransferase PlsY
MWIAPFMVIGYLAGSITFGYWLVRLTKGVDIRTVGSHNLGATNVWRVYGWRYGLPVMALDILKAFVPVFVATHVAGHLVGVLTGAAAMVGHARPIYLKFAKGGKMVATAGGAFLGVAPLLGLAGVGVWLVLFVVTRYASVSSILAAASLAPLAYGLGYPWPVITFGGAAGAGVAVLHRANVRRLLAGEESRFQLRRSGKVESPTEIPVSR